MLRTLALTATVMLLLATAAAAQTGAGLITGVITDQNRAAVPGATITVTESRTSLRRVVVSSLEGVYTAARF